MSRWMLGVTPGIFALWGIWGLVEALTDKFVLFYSFRSFGLISPLVGALCLVLSVSGLLRARQLRQPRRYARPGRDLRERCNRAGALFGASFRSLVSRAENSSYLGPGS